MDNNSLLRCFETGLPGSLATEEGLAMVAEERTGTHSPGVLARQLEVLKAITLAREMGFHEIICHTLGTRWQRIGLGHLHRIKRGLSRPDLPECMQKTVSTSKVSHASDPMARPWRSSQPTLRREGWIG